MKLLFIDTLKAYQLTREEQYNVKAEGPSLKGGPDTDGEENCFKLPSGSTYINKKGEPAICL
ncbi:hypothetical protein [Tenacibaculum ovolyticum]|uniref:hypothetical protein n=1 Tax=Tenacibaculum ovolyticum TaxID=104270 RepID=UPI0007ECE386|nr:hypothetical protein [Tenacibaculum ovolyticum]